MVRLFCVERYKLDKTAAQRTALQARALFTGLETVITQNIPEAQNISHTGKGILGHDWETRSYGRVYELPNGVAYLDFAHHESGDEAWLSGDVILVGNEGLEGKEGQLVDSIRKYFKVNGIEAKEEFPLADQTSYAHSDS